MGKTYAVGLISALAASASLSQTNSIAFADGPFNFSTLFPSTSGASSQSPPLSSSSGQSQPSNSAQSEVANTEASVPKAPRNDNPRTTSAGFDPEALERGAKALREIASSSQAKKVCY